MSAGDHWRLFWLHARHPGWRVFRLFDGWWAWKPGRDLHAESLQSLAAQIAGRPGPGLPS